MFASLYKTANHASRLLLHSLIINKITPCLLFIIFTMLTANPHAIDLPKSGKKSHDLAKNLRTQSSLQRTGFQSSILCSPAQLRLGSQASSTPVVGGVIC